MFRKVIYFKNVCGLYGQRIRTSGIGKLCIRVFSGEAENWSQSGCKEVDRANINAFFSPLGFWKKEAEE